MHLSIISVNYRSWALLAALLDDLVGCADFVAGKWEIIVVDNDSGDHQLEDFARRYAGVRFIRNQGNLGFAHGNNLGADAATGEHLLFMNPDMRASEQAIETLWQLQKQQPSLALLTAIQEDSRGRLQKAFDRFPDLLSYFRTVRNVARWLAPGRNPDPRNPRGEPVYCDWISGSLLLIARADFQRLGGWSEDFWMYAEDMDLCRRAADAGMQRALTTRARFVHHHGGTSRRNIETTVLTKTEVMISAHVYISRHFAGLHAGANHLIVIVRDLTPLLIATFMNILTLGLFRGLRLRTRLCGRLCVYLLQAARRGSWLSPRAPAYAQRAKAV